MNKEKFKLNCKYFKGDRPCQYNQICENCNHYFPVGKRILIIKLDSKGDVLRTTPILRKLKQIYPNSYITWLTSVNSKPILVNNDFIDRTFIYNFSSYTKLQCESFDLLLSLDKDPKAAAVASLIKANKKLGYGLSREGNIFPLSKSAEYEFCLGLCDRLKFEKNTKSYQELIFEIAEFEFKGEEYVLPLDKEVERLKRKIKKRYNLRTEDFVIGLNIGCGDVFPHKKWTVEGFLKLIQKLLPSENNKVVILAGPNEKSRYQNILNKIDSSVITPGCDNTLEEFISFVGCCDIVVTGDTLGMHIAIALKKKVIALFGPTCSQEVCLYNRGMKIISESVCVPCYKNECDFNPNCMMNISVDNIYESINKLKE